MWGLGLVGAFTNDWMNGYLGRKMYIPFKGQSWKYHIEDMHHFVEDP